MRVCPASRIGYSSERTPVLVAPGAARARKHADVAQLVAHHLAKVRVAGSNPVVRSEAPDAVVCGRRPTRLPGNLPSSWWPGVAEWPSGLGKGLQSPVRGFDSRFRLDGRLAQRESTSLTRKGSLVQSQYRPPITAGQSTSGHRLALVLALELLGPDRGLLTERETAARSRYHTRQTPRRPNLREGLSRSGVLSGGLARFQPDIGDTRAGARVGGDLVATVPKIGRAHV